ncbi:MAG: EVE domain-containing protein [Lacisediminihabitans sp.]
MNHWLGDDEPLKQFTAIGKIVDDEIWQADEGSFTPFRRRVDYLSGTTPAGVGALANALDLTSGPNWGYQLRRGPIPPTEHDFVLILNRMTAA